MAARVKDLVDSLKGSVSRELMSREGRRIRPSVGPKPEDNADVHAGALGQVDLNPVERKQVAAGGHIEGLDSDPGEAPTDAHGVSAKEEKDER